MIPFFITLFGFIALLLGLRYWAITCIFFRNKFGICSDLVFKLYLLMMFFILTPSIMILLPYIIYTMYIMLSFFRNLNSFKNQNYIQFLAIAIFFIIGLYGQFNYYIIKLQERVIFPRNKKSLAFYETYEGKDLHKTLRILAVILNYGLFFPCILITFIAWIYNISI